MDDEKNIAKILLKKNAVRLNAKEPYTYSSGIRSPIYCDNRTLTFFPHERTEIVECFVKKIKDLNPDVIAGTASSAISWAAWVSERLNKPLVYIRKKTKEYGTEKLIEGGDITDKKVIVIEDLVSTGGSSINAVKNCRKAGAKVPAVAAIFTYEMDKAKIKFNENKCKLLALSNFSALINMAKKLGKLNEKELEMVLKWNKDPVSWGPKHGFLNKK